MNCVSGRSRDSQLDLRTCSVLAPDFHLSADAFGALAHTRYAVMPRASFQDPVRVNADAVILNADSKVPRVVLDFNFNSLGPRVAEGIAQRFRRNPIDLVPYYRVQLL